MEPDAFSLDVAKKSLQEQGFIERKAPAVGDDILELERQDFPFWTEDGLDFCNKHVLYEAVSMTGCSASTI